MNIHLGNCVYGPRYPAPAQMTPALLAWLYDDYGRHVRLVAPEYEVKRRADALEQRRKGFNGGGMACPACGRRGLKMLDEERAKGQPTRMFCETYHGAKLVDDRGCGAEVLMSVRGGYLVLEGGGVTTWNGQETDVPF